MLLAAVAMQRAKLKNALMTCLHDNDASAQAQRFHSNTIWICPAKAEKAQVTAIDLMRIQGYQPAAVAKQRAKLKNALMTCLHDNDASAQAHRVH